MSTAAKPFTLAFLGRACDGRLVAIVAQPHAGLRVARGFLLAPGDKLSEIRLDWARVYKDGSITYLGERFMLTTAAPTSRRGPHMALKEAGFAPRKAVPVESLIAPEAADEARLRAALTAFGLTLDAAAPVFHAGHNPRSPQAEAVHEETVRVAPQPPAPPASRNGKPGPR